MNRLKNTKDERDEMIIIGKEDEGTEKEKRR
jgi:hypothetical protein